MGGGNLSDKVLVDKSIEFPVRMFYKRVCEGIDAYFEMKTFETNNTDDCDEKVKKLIAYQDECAGIKLADKTTVFAPEKNFEECEQIKCCPKCDAANVVRYLEKK